MSNSAIIKAAKLVIGRTHIPKSLRGKVEIIVNDEGVKIIKINKNKNG